MSLQLAAKHLAQQGRGNDSALVHMTPKELASLQTLAQRNGGSLSINPQTGLPEAGFLESLLPAVIGGGLSVASGGAIDPMTAAMLVGGGQAMMTGDLNKGLMAGIGAYGGAGMGSYMANAGSVVPAAAKDTVVQQTAAEIAPVSVPVEAAPAPAATTYAPTGFKFSNSNTSAAVQDALANSRMPAMQTNPAVEGYLQNNRSMMPLSTPTPMPLPDPAQVAAAQSLPAPMNYPGGSFPPTVMNTAKDFDAFQRGLTGENALSFMKANPMQAAALASGPLMEATTATPPKAAVDSDRGTNANAGIKYRPNFVNPLPAPNRYGIEQVYNRPTYMAEGGKVEHYVAGGLTPALRTYQQLQQQRAGRGSQIDAKQQFDEYMKSVRGGTVRPTLPPVPTPTPITPTTPIDTSTVNTGGGGRGQGGDEGTPGEGFSPTSEGAYNVSRFGQQLGYVSPIAGGLIGAYGNYLAKNVNPNYSNEGRSALQEAHARDALADAESRAFTQTGSPLFSGETGDTVNYGLNPYSAEKTISANKFSLGDDPQSIANKAYSGVTVSPYQPLGTLNEATSFPGAFGSYSPSEAAGISALNSSYTNTSPSEAAGIAALDSSYANYSPSELAGASMTAPDPFAGYSPSELAGASMTAPDPFAGYSPSELAGASMTAPEAPTVSEAPAVETEVDPYDFDMPAQYAAETAHTTAETIDRINAALAASERANREAEAEAARAEAEKAEAASAAAIETQTTIDRMARNAEEAEREAANQAALDAARAVADVPLGEGFVSPAAPIGGVDLTDGTDSPFSDGVSGPQVGDVRQGSVEGKDLDGTGAGAFPGGSGAPPSGGSGDNDGGGYTGGNFGDSASDNNDSMGRGDSDSGGESSGGESSGGESSGGESSGGGDGDGGGDGGDGGGDGGGDARGGYYRHGQFDYHPFAQGGYAYGGLPNPYNLGSYSDGGRLLKGPGDGVSDSIPATIGKGRPARLADGEFVIPARIVSEIGNGSTDAGARKLYAMMDRIQASRKKTVGKGKVAKNTRAEKYLPR